MIPRPAASADDVFADVVREPRPKLQFPEFAFGSSGASTCFKVS